MHRKYFWAHLAWDVPNDFVILKGDLPAPCPNALRLGEYLHFCLRWCRLSGSTNVLYVNVEFQVNIVYMLFRERGRRVGWLRPYSPDWWVDDFVVRAGARWIKETKITSPRVWFNCWIYITKNKNYNKKKLNNGVFCHWSLELFKLQFCHSNQICFIWFEDSN